MCLYNVALTHILHKLVISYHFTFPLVNLPLEMIYQQHTLNCRGTVVVIDRPLVMGILNVTPDSFFDGGAYGSHKDAVAHAGRMLKEGV